MAQKLKAPELLRPQSSSEQMFKKRAWAYQHDDGQGGRGHGIVGHDDDQLAGDTCDGLEHELDEEGYPDVHWKRQRKKGVMCGQGFFFVHFFGESKRPLAGNLS